MAQISDGPSQNRFFIVSNLSDTLKAGRNSFVVNPTDLIVPTANIYFNAYDANGNELHSGPVQATNAKYAEGTDTGYLYFVNVPSDTIPGIGTIEIRSVGLDVVDYTGSIAFYGKNAYKISSNQRLPLLQAPSTASISQIRVLWSANVVIDPSKKTDSEVRFFDYPKMEAVPQIYDCPEYPTSSYVVSSGSFSSIAVLPKNNQDGDFDYQYDKPIYQLYWKNGPKFSSSMENEYVRIKAPSVKNFTYSDYSNNTIVYEGVLNTDFIAKIESVVNDTTLLLDLPFSTVSQLIERSNQDSPYSKNNLTKIKGYGTNNDPYKQTVNHKKNFYVLSIDAGEFEIIHKSMPSELPRATPSGSLNYKKLVIDANFSNLRVLCGDLDHYRIYGRSLNSPETKTLMCEGKIKPINLLMSTKFDNAVYDSPGEFYNQTHLSKYWLSSSLDITFIQSNEILINGATISHNGNQSENDYVIFKDNTSDNRASAYLSFNTLADSYWYAKSDAFVNYSAYPTASYSGLQNAAILASYGQSQETLLSGAIHDSNPINIKKNALYEFSMVALPGNGNTESSVLNVYFISGEDRIKIGTIDSTAKFVPGKKYKNTFFSDIERYGTIILVPIAGSWSISKISLQPYQGMDYSPDTFRVKIPLKPLLNNELYEIEAELYDSAGRLAYGEDSYTFTYNQTFLPLKKQLFLDPAGITLIPEQLSKTGGGGGAAPIFIDGGGA